MIVSDFGRLNLLMECHYTHLVFNLLLAANIYLTFFVKRLTNIFQGEEITWLH